MTGREFFKACKDFDWYYSFSDDHSVWLAGQERYNQLERIVKSTETPYWYSYIFESWQNYINSHINCYYFAGQKLEAPREEVFETFFFQQEQGGVKETE